MIHTVVLVKPITNHWVQYTHTWLWYTLWCLWSQSQTTGCNTPTPDHDTHCGVSETNHKPLGAIHPHLTMIHTVVFVKPITNHWVQYTHTWPWYTLWCLWNQSPTTGCNTPTPDHDTHCGVCETNHKPLGAIHPHLTMIHTVVFVIPITNHWVQYTHTWPWYTLWCLWSQSQTTGCNTPTPDYDTHCGVSETNHETLAAIHPHLTMIHTVVFVKPITNHWVQYTHTWLWYTLWCLWNQSQTTGCNTPTPDYDTHCGVSETNHKPLGAIHPHLTMIHTVVFVKPITNHWLQYTHTWLCITFEGRKGIVFYLMTHSTHFIYQTYGKGPLR